MSIILNPNIADFWTAKASNVTTILYLWKIADISKNLEKSNL